MKKKRICDIVAIFILGIIICFIFNDIIFDRTKTFLGLEDACNQSYAWLNKIWNAWHNGEIALWDFNQYGGTSYAGEIQTAPFYLPNLIFSVVVPTFSAKAVDIFIVFHYYIAAVGAYFFARINKMSLLPSIIGALFFSVIGTVAIRAFGQPNIFMSMIWLPWVLGFYELAIMEKQSRIKVFYYLTFSGIILGNMILAGHMQPYIHAVIAIVIMGIFEVVKCKELKRIFIVTLGCGIVSIIISFGQIVSGLEYLKLSYRWVGLENPIKGFVKLPESAFISTIEMSDLKDIFVDTLMLQDDCSLYVGIIGFIFIAYGLVKGKKELKWYAFFILIVSIIISFGDKNIVGKIVIHTPVVNTIREPIRFLYLYNFATSILISIGVQEFMDNTRKHLERKSYIKYKNAFFIIVMVSVVFINIYEAKGFIGKRLVDVNLDSCADKAYAEDECIINLRKLCDEDLQNGLCFRYVCNTNEETLTPNLASAYNDLYSVHGHRATMLVKYFDFLSNVEWDWTNRLGELLSVKYFVSNQSMELGSNWSLCFMQDGKYIYSRNNIDSMFSVMKEDNSFESACCDSIIWKCNSVKLQINAKEEQTIRFSQLMYPGWKVFINQQEYSIKEDSNGFMTVDIPKGENCVEFIYSPQWMNIWKWLLIAWVIVFVTISMMFIRDEKANEKNML